MKSQAWIGAGSNPLFFSGYNGLRMTTVLSHTVVRWTLPILTLAWVVFLFWVSTYTRGALPPAGSTSGFPSLTMGPPLHLGAYGVLASLLMLSTWAVWPRTTALSVSFAAPFVAATAYGAALELYQTVLLTRAGSWGDVALNATGAALGLALLTKLRLPRGSVLRL